MPGAVLQTVELSRPLPFRAAPSLHFAMSVSAEEVAKHNKDGDVCFSEPDVGSVMFWDWACRHVRVGGQRLLGDRWRSGQELS